MNSTERTFYGSPFWAQKGTFFKCSDKNESFYLQKVCFSDREKFSTSPKNRENSAQRFPMGRVVGWELSFTEDFVVIPTIDLEIQLFVGRLWVALHGGN
ncbi:hypothetical protein LEP1GSC151_5198 [Leptospira interrogans serovar Grippotyphosa str. LT2186]|uniref:Uncharacterized protein n=1 Tax=Leptospira interrogans serovar Grippotyphosa str. LT2186 TaxID=1001599 RepID=M3FTC2_LEPIR|nr:hypothetical protein LEP1GSC097_0761 [Leptospira interrogans serovar Grippotyphosa str. UI 08368]EMG10659.1 hypothetical protein LEP1GSC151_5198 [Leptospira interrogans serovar Grippotyphosa str. LT2186]